MSASGNGGAAPYHGAGAAYLAQEGNPLGQVPGTFFHRRGVLLRERRQDLRTFGSILMPVTVREWVMPTLDAIAAQPIFSWTKNVFNFNDQPAQGAVTNPLRYRVSTQFLGQGNQLVNPGARTFVRYPTRPHAPDPVFYRAGQQQGRPTIRNRITSFGSRVPSINAPLPSSEN